MKTAWNPFTRDQWLYCLRVGLAVSIAYLLAHGSDPAGSIYAVLAAGLVIGETVGEGIGISRDRLIGSLLGVIVAVPISALAAPSVWTVTASCIIAGLIGLSFGRVAPARVAITVAAVSVLLHPENTADYGLFRITNTLLGVSVAVGVSYLFWPIIGRDAHARVIRNVLAASADLLQAVAATERADLIRRRRRSLFRALAAIPKVNKEASQDPLLRRHSIVNTDAMAIAAELGVHVLAASVVPYRLSPEDRRSSWWPALAAALAATAEVLRAAGEWPAAKPSGGGIAPEAAPMQTVFDAIGDARLREAAIGALHDLHTVQDRIADLRRMAPEAPS